MLFYYGITVIINIYVNAFFNANYVKEVKVCFTVSASSYTKVYGFIIAKGNCVNVSFIIVKTGCIIVCSFIIAKGSYINIYNTSKKRKRGT